MRKSYECLQLCLISHYYLSDKAIHSEKRSEKKLPGFKQMQEHVERRDIAVRQQNAVAELAYISSAPGI